MERRARAAQQHNVTEVFGRLRALEGDVASIRADLSAISANQVSQSNMLTHIADTVDKRGATDWKALAAWTAVLLAIVGMYTTLTTAPLKEGLQTSQDDIARVAQRQGQAIDREVYEAERRGRYLQQIDDMRRDVSDLEQRIDRRPPP